MLLVAPPVGAMSSARGETPPQTASQSSPKRADIPADIAISETHIFVLKFMLQLRPEQEGHWLPVEAALRELARSQAAADARHVSTPGSRTRTAEKPEIANRLREIAVLARPLLRSLDVNQRQNWRRWRAPRAWSNCSWPRNNVASLPFNNININASHRRHR
jgi:hypothetical protein